MWVLKFLIKKISVQWFTPNNLYFYFLARGTDYDVIVPGPLEKNWLSEMDPL